MTNNIVKEKEDDNVQTRKTNKLPKNKAGIKLDQIASQIGPENLALPQPYLFFKDLKKFFKTYGEIESTRLRSVVRVRVGPPGIVFHSLSKKSGVSPPSQCTPAR